MCIIANLGHFGGRGAFVYYKPELDFLRAALTKMRLQTVLLHPDDVPEETPDFGLRTFLGHEDEYSRLFQSALNQVKENTIYKLTDVYHCNYMFLRLPEAVRPACFLVGPYLSPETTRRKIMETAERFGLPAAQLSQLENYYMNIPVIADETPLLVMMNVFAERLWGTGNAYEIVSLNQDATAGPLTHSEAADEEPRENTLLQMNIMETRYSFENELMETVSKGLVHRAELLLSNMTQDYLESRSADPLRNLKNYCVISNTLMRKAAERGGVHPVQLNRVSSDFARTIESLSSLEKGEKLMREIVRTYCRLVRNHSTARYSPLVQKAVDYIESDLSADLSLHNLARAHNVSASYLSSLFRRETGKTVTEFVNERRMERGARLLRITRLQVQTIAQHCGMSDANYFSKMFKKHYGKTPKQFREEQNANEKAATPERGHGSV